MIALSAGVGSVRLSDHVWDLTLTSNRQPPTKVCPVGKAPLEEGEIRTSGSSVDVLPLVRAGDDFGGDERRDGRE